jgi:hypothetical protein
MPSCPNVTLLAYPSLLSILISPPCSWHFFVMCIDFRITGGSICLDKAGELMIYGRKPVAFYPILPRQEDRRQGHWLLKERAIPYTTRFLCVRLDSEGRERVARKGRRVSTVQAASPPGLYSLVVVAIRTWFQGVKGRRANAICLKLLLSCPLYVCIQGVVTRSFVVI